MAIVDHVEVGFPGTLECPPIRMRVPVYDALPESGVEGQLAGLRKDGQDEAFVWWGDSWTAPGTSCDCGGRWVSTSVSYEAVWGTHRDRAGNPVLPAPGCRHPDGTVFPGRLPSGSYVVEDGSVLD